MSSLKVGIAGLGTVGVGVLKILSEQKDVLDARNFNSLQVTAVSSRNKDKDRGVDISNIEWFDNASKMAESENINIFVELIGGSDGIAYDSIKTALKNKKHVVTANKALIATHGFELAELAEENNVSLLFEASVAGGIPVIKTMKEALAGNNITKVTGILNGTCNYIITEMFEKGLDFGVVLKTAQELGYAEADPSFDIDGVDAAHKLVILTSLAFNTKPNLNSAHIEGIRDINLKDIKYAYDLGYSLRLLGIAQKNNSGEIEQFIYPCLVNKESDIGKVDGVLGAVKLECDALGQFFQTGAGAGMMPTASAVLSDLSDIASNRKSHSFSVSSKDLKEGKFAEINTKQGVYFIRFTVKDNDGVLSKISQIFSNNSIGIEQVHQKKPESDNADIIFITHIEKEEDVKNAIEAVNNQEFISGKTAVLRVG